MSWTTDDAEVTDKADRPAPVLIRVFRDIRGMVLMGRRAFRISTLRERGVREPGTCGK